MKSAIGTPHFTGAPPGSPVTLMTPAVGLDGHVEAALAARAGRVWPKAEIEQ